MKRVNSSENRSDTGEIIGTQGDLDLVVTIISFAQVGAFFFWKESANFSAYFTNVSVITIARSRGGVKVFGNQCSLS